MSNKENVDPKEKKNTEGLKQWEKPQLFVENTEDITESGAFNLNDQDDMFLSYLIFLICFRYNDLILQ